MGGASHFAGLASLPRVEPGDGGLDLVLPFLVDGADPPDVLLTQDDGAREWSAHDLQPVTLATIAALRQADLTAGQWTFRVAPYLDAEKALQGDVAQRYAEVRLPGLAAGTCIRYGLAARGAQQPARSYAVVVVADDFSRQDICRGHLADAAQGGLDLDRSWLLHHRRAHGFDQFRLDLLDISAFPLNLAVQVGEHRFDLARPETCDLLPLVDPTNDSVVFAVPSADPLPEVVVDLRGDRVRVDLTGPRPAYEARVMFLHFAIQGLNDYFATPNTAYDPPRTYAQTTMRDEKATFSSRPDSPENAIGDGYAATLDAHRRLRMRHLWALNAGLLDLLAFDCPDDLEQLRRDIEAGLLEPVVTGFASHRLPYYDAATNADSIRDGVAVQDGLLGCHGRAYFPDSRIFKRLPQVTGPLRASGLGYLVLEAQTAFDRVTTWPPLDRDGAPPRGDRFLDDKYLWRDAATGMTLLLISAEMRDGMFGGTPEEVARGKLPLALREMLMAFALQPDERRGNISIYGDDADKASGNGWFDGSAEGVIDFNKSYQASLTWLSRHPWVRAVVTADLGDDDVVGTAEVLRSTDPCLGEVPGPPSTDLGFDARVQEWRDRPAAWLGETLGEVSDRAERAVKTWPAPYRGNRLFDLARLTLQMCLHESQWSKWSRTPAAAPICEPEDFVVAETLQMRHVHVYLAASVWAEWAAGRTGSPTYVNDGPVVDLVAGLDDALSGSARPAWRREDHAQARLQWDHDPNPLAVLYNDQVLVVADQNGGRVVNIFARYGGRPYSVSGTFKAYQFLEADWSDGHRGDTVECDGLVLQNDVWTPNHAYVACDADVSRGSVGDPPSGSALRWRYPDNLNRYGLEVLGDGVRFSYGARQATPGSLTVGALADCLTADREAVVGGRQPAAPWRDPTAPGHAAPVLDSLTKTLSLAGRVLTVAYAGAPAGHTVANELSLDLWAGVMRGRRQTRHVDGSRIVLRTPAGVAARVVLGKGCHFSDETLRVDPPSPRLHRVLTDCVDVQADDDGAFDYSVELPDDGGAG